MKRKTGVFLMMFLLLVLASCKSIDYTVEFIFNDDENSTLTKVVKSGEVLESFDVEYSKYGYIFDYWMDEDTNKEFIFENTKIKSDKRLIGVWKSDGIRRGTFNREYPSYYEVNKPLIDDGHVVYINFDGFARYYYDEAIKRDPNSLPTITQIMSEGVFFDDLRTTTPSITNPTQNMIISSATTALTKNVYRYYDRDKNIVIQQARENEMETIVDRVVDANLPIASISFYLAEPQLSPVDPERLYIRPDSTNPKVVERGEKRGGDYFSRFEQLIKLVKGEPIKTGGGTVVVEKLPKLIMIYADDLDAHGHNQVENYGVPVSASESERLDKMVKELREMDEKLGDFINAAKEAGVYDKMTFFFTTDHGMTPFGAISSSEGGKYIHSKIADLAYALSQFDRSFELEKVEPEGKPQNRTTVVGVGANLNLQLTFRNGITDEELEELKEHLLKEEYVGVVKTRKELEEEGYWTYAADMIVSPAERYSFAPNVLAQYRVRGQHDSYLESANKIFGVVWGKGIKKGYVYEQRAYNYDFGITMAAALGLDLPQANGIVLDIFNIKED